MEDPSSDRVHRPCRRALVGAFGAGLLGFALGSSRAGGGAPSRRTVAWVADRDGHRVHALDRALVLVRTVAIERPVRLVAARGGGLWVLGAPVGAAGPARLVRLGEHGAVGATREVAPCVAAVSVPPDHALLLVEEPGEGPRLVRVAPGGARTSAPAPPHASCLAASRAGRVLVGTRDGTACLLASDAADVVERDLRGAGEPLALCAAADGGWWWLGGDGRLLRLTPDLAVLAAIELAPWRPTALVAGPQDRAWLIDGAGARVRCVDRRGVTLGEGEVPLVDGLGAGAAEGGDLLITAGGALLRLDSSCRALCSQGGFEWLSDVAACDV